MPLDKKERKAQLMKISEEIIDRLLSEEKAGDEVMLEDIERAAVQGGEALRSAIAAVLVEAMEDRTSIVCSDCGKRMTYQGKRSKQLVTEAGELTLQRDYYYCRGCKRGSFPPR